MTITGTNLACGTTRSLSCGGVATAISSLSATEITTFIPPGAQDCRFSFTTAGGTVTVPPEQSFDVVLSRDFSLAVNPAGSMVIQGSSTLYRVSANGEDGFADLITLSVMGLPAGVTGSFFPATITAG